MFWPLNKDRTCVVGIAYTVFVVRDWVTEFGAESSPLGIGGSFTCRKWMFPLSVIQGWEGSRRPAERPGDG